MSFRLTIDPVTRIEGHLKIEVEIDNGKVQDAWSSGTMYRGFEKLLEGRDPRDAPFVTGRFCGVCFSVHTLASALALDQAFGATVPTGGRLIRNLIMGAQYLYDHIVHFYLLSALDYLNLSAVLAYQGSDAALLAVKDQIAALLSSGDAHPLLPSYQPDALSVSDPETVTTLVKHYLDALRLQMLCKKMGAILGGRAPHYQSIVVGGVTQLPTAEKITAFRALLVETGAFIRDTYAKDVTALARGALWPLATSGFGAGHTRYLAYGGFPQSDTGNPLFPAGVLRSPGGAPEELDVSRITESVGRSFYRKAKPVHPSAGEQEVDMTNQAAYSFVKAPRYDTAAVEVGPLARMLILGHPAIKDFLGAGGKPGVVARHLSRALESQMLVEAMGRWLTELEQAMARPGFAIHDRAHWDVPATAEGAGFYEAPRGALGHWIRIENQLIKRYQAVVPSTWNASPRDEAGVRGAYEESLIGVEVPDPDNPVNLVRVVRSFDPCLACAVHVIHPQTREIRRFVVDPVTGS